MDRDGRAKSSEDAGRGENSILHAEDDFADAREALDEELLRSWIEGRHARSARAGVSISYQRGRISRPVPSPPDTTAPSAARTTRAESRSHCGQRSPGSRRSTRWCVWNRG